MKTAVIRDKIYEIRGQKVMLDYDLADLYQVETRVLNQAVKRNRSRFPVDFMFRLTKKEWQRMSSQIVMTSLQKRPHSSLPWAFTEHGVTMLGNILKSPRAVKMSIAVVRAFIALKKKITDSGDLTQKLELLRTEIETRFGEHDTQLAAIYDAIENLLDEKAGQLSWEERARIGYK